MKGGKTKNHENVPFSSPLQLLLLLWKAGCSPEPPSPCLQVRGHAAMPWSTSCPLRSAGHLPAEALAKSSTGTQRGPGDGAARSWALPSAPSTPSSPGFITHNPYSKNTLLPTTASLRGSKKVLKNGIIFITFNGQRSDSPKKKKASRKSKPK